MFTSVRRAVKRRFGLYRFLPLFFFTGAAIELFMIKVRIGRETFYDTVVRKEAERRAERQNQELEDIPADNSPVQ